MPPEIKDWISSWILTIHKDLLPSVYVKIYLTIASVLYHDASFTNECFAMLFPSVWRLLFYLLEDIKVIIPFYLDVETSESARGKKIIWQSIYLINISSPVAAISLRIPFQDAFSLNTWRGLSGIPLLIEGCITGMGSSSFLNSKRDLHAHCGSLLLSTPIFCDFQHLCTASLHQRHILVIPLGVLPRKYKRNLFSCADSD